MAEKKGVTYNGIAFTPSAFDKKEADFIKHESHHGLSPEQLKEVYAAGTGKNAPSTEKEVTQ
jgi:hypothetical protein